DRHREEDRPRALGEGEERGARRRQGRAPGRMVGAQGAVRGAGVQEARRRLRGRARRGQPPAPVGEGRVGHQVRGRKPGNRRALPPKEGARGAIRRGIRPHHRREARGAGPRRAVLRAAGGREASRGRGAQDGAQPRGAAGGGEEARHRRAVEDDQGGVSGGAFL
ncbi:MAG: hypothetical protein AVDCRST_MAG39-2302, partial [uncultured Sphingomonadaceae bacterium]